jgi:DNA sulfur modification protein DndB
VGSPPWRARTILNSYFDRISSANTELWDLGRQGLVCTNRSLRAYIQLLASIVDFMQAEKSLDPRELEPMELMLETEEYLKPVLDWLKGATLADVTEGFDVKYGSGGPTQYHWRLCRLVKEVFPEFSPEGLDDWIESQSAVRVEQAERTQPVRLATLLRFFSPYTGDVPPPLPR